MVMVIQEPHAGSGLARMVSMLKVLAFMVASHVMIFGRHNVEQVLLLSLSLLVTSNVIFLVLMEFSD